MTTMRLFVAVVPPEEALEHLDAFLEPRREAGEFRWTDPSQVHVTLAFLARVQEWQLDELVDRLQVAAARRTPFPARIAGGGAFPDVGRARVLWTGLALDEIGDVELDRLAAGARAAAGRTGIEVDGQRFRPHLTIARLGRPTELTNWVRLLDSYAGPDWTADRITLVQSHLGEGTRRRPRYESVAAVALGSPA